MSAQILVVEDDNEARRTLTHILEGGGYRVLAAHEGQRALDLIERVSIDLVLSDIRMVGVDGVTLIQRLRQRPQPPAMILLTGYAALETAIQALDAQVDAYLLKPCPPEVLLDRVALALRRRAEQRQLRDAFHTITTQLGQLMDHTALLARTRSEALLDCPLVVGPLQVGEGRRSASLAGRPLALTPIEHAILRCLGSTPGQLWTYPALAEQTHGYTTSEREAAALLKTHVRNLRRKLPPGMLLTVRDSGYRLVDPAGRA